MFLKLYNTLTKVSYTIENLVDLAQNPINYKFSLTLPAGVDSGEYEYELYDDENNLKTSGLLQIGSYTPEKTQYTAQTHNGYIQYGE